MGSGRDGAIVTLIGGAVLPLALIALAMWRRAWRPRALALLWAYGMGLTLLPALASRIPAVVALVGMDFLLGALVVGIATSSVSACWTLWGHYQEAVSLALWWGIFLGVAGRIAAYDPSAGALLWDKFTIGMTSLGAAMIVAATVQIVRILKRIR